MSAVLWDPKVTVLLSLWVASAVAGFFSGLCLSRRYGTKVLFFVLALAALGGPLGFFLALFFLRALRAQKLGAVPFEVSTAEATPFEVFRGRRLGEGGALATRPDIAVYLSRNVSPLSFARLKYLVFSQEEETRLVAFTTLHKMESSLSSEIDRLLRELPVVQGEERFAVLAALAELYSEFVFLGIADRELEDFYLRTAERYAEEALALRESGKHHCLLGRILLRRGEVQEAEKHLLLAAQSGFPRERVLPYLLECAYKQGDFARVVSLARSAKGLCFIDQKAWSIVKFWSGERGSCGCCR